MIALASSRLIEASSRPGIGLLLPSDFRNIRNRMPLRIPLPKSLTSKGCKHTHECGRSVDKGLGTKFIYHTIVITGIGMGANSRIGTGDECSEAGADVSSVVVVVFVVIEVVVGLVIIVVLVLAVVVVVVVVVVIVVIV